MSMKGGRDDESCGDGGEKIMVPMFPRLHVNDREKGGPRAPPRNKLALYEQLSIPAKRFSSTSSNQGGGHEKSVFSPFYSPPAFSTENGISRSSDRTNLNTRLVEFERKSAKNGSYRTSNITGHSSSTAECSSAQRLEISSSKNSFGKKSGDDDNYLRVHVNSGTGQGPKDQHGTSREMQIPFCPTHLGRSTNAAVNSHKKSVAPTCNSSVKLQNAYAKPMKKPNTMDIKYRRIPNSNSGSSRFYQESSVGLPPKGNNHDDRVSFEPRQSNGAELGENEDPSRVRSETSSRLILGNGSPNRDNIFTDEGEEKVCGSLQARDVDRNDDVSGTSIVDSISGTDISPDDVVEVIGQKHFWEARRAIVNQQRVFAVQVFELHRLIKVQKLIAESPNMLLEDKPYFTRPPQKVSTKKLPSEFIMKSQPQIVKQKDEPRKPIQNTESLTENAIEKLPVPPRDGGADKGPVSQVSYHGPYPGNPPPIPMAADNKSSPWGFHPPGNQWLVPVMSPSEGLVYKPYTGPCAPTSGFMAPVYGTCEPLSLPPVAGAFMNPAYGLPTSHPQQGVAVIPGAPVVPRTFFPPYGLPVMNPIIPGTMQATVPAAEPGNQSSGIRSNGQADQFSMGEMRFNMQSGSSCNMLTKSSEAFPYPARKFQSQNDTEFQGSTASSACERADGRAGAKQVSEGRDALPLFPLAPALEALDQEPSQGGKQPGQVIRVVPHNPRSATESAARIFRSIQEERQQLDSP